MWKAVKRDWLSISVISFIVATFICMAIWMETPNEQMRVNGLVRFNPDGYNPYTQATLYRVRRQLCGQPPAIIVINQDD